MGRGTVAADDDAGDTDEVTPWLVVTELKEGDVIGLVKLEIDEEMEEAEDDDIAPPEEFTGGSRAGISSFQDLKC